MIIRGLILARVYGGHFEFRRSRIHGFDGGLGLSPDRRRIHHGGLVLNAFLGWWWADPVAGLVMVPIIAKEGVEGVRSDRCSAKR